MGDQPNKESTDTLDQTKIKIVVDGKEKEITIKEAKELAQKGESYTTKTQALKDKERSLEAKLKTYEAWKPTIDKVEANPQLRTALSKTITDVESGKISKVEGDTRSLKIVDKWIDKATNSEDREAYKELREAIKEETNISGVLEEIKDLKEEVTFLRSTSTIGLSNKVEGDLQKLDDELGKEFVDKYRVEVKKLAVKYPNQSVKKLLYHMASDDEGLEEALISRAEKRKKLELERKKKGSSVGGEETVAPKSKYTYDKAGRATTESIVQRAKERLGKT